MPFLAANRPGRALFADTFGNGASFNLARYLFLDPRSQDFYPGWQTVAADCVAALRTHNVKLHHTATTKAMHHALAGDLELTGEALQLPGDPDLTIITYELPPVGRTPEVWGRRW